MKCENPRIQCATRRLVATALAAASISAGCRVSPVPPKIDHYYAEAHRLYKEVNPVLQEGDLIFRRGHFPMFGGLINYSRVLAYWTASPFAHVGMVYQKIDDTYLIVDTSIHGIERKFLIDWLIEGPENIVVKRLTPEYRHKIPELLSAAKDLVDRDVLHDDAFITNDDKFYCTEIVDHVFRSCNMPLAERIPIRNLPRIKPLIVAPLYEVVGLLAGIDMDREVATAGNEDTGLYSSPMLEEVINFLPPKFRRPPFTKSAQESAPANAP